MIRIFLISLIAFLTLIGNLQANSQKNPDRPNIVIITADDLGWGDVAYNGHPHVKTPSLDHMVKNGLRFNRFYAAAPVCSPTRGSIMTGRHPARFGCFNPNFSIRPEEVTLAEILSSAGYVTGHFGKWHLGPVKAGTPVNPGGSGFGTWVSHDNWFDLNPPLSRNGAEPKKFQGESSAIVADEAIKFIKKVHKKGKSFFAYVCFASPHLPHQGIQKDLDLYKKLPKKQQVFLSEITAMDRAIGRLRDALQELGISENTLVIFSSDNGAIPVGSTGGLRGGKGTLYEGGVRIPAVMEWPGHIKKGSVTEVPCVTSDFLPTIVDLLKLKVEQPVRPLDGISIKGVLDGSMKKRPTIIAFWRFRGKGGESYLPKEQLKGWWRTFRNSKYSNPRTKDFPGHAAIIDNRYKLHQIGSKYQLYDLIADPKESVNLADKKADVVQRLRNELHAWQRSVEVSLTGADYKK